MRKNLIFLIENMGNWLVCVCIYFLFWRCWTFSLNSHSPYVPHYCSPITMISPLLVHVSWLRPQNFSIFLFPPFPVCPASLHLHLLFLHSCLRLAWGVIALLVSHTWAPARLPAACQRLHKDPNLPCNLFATRLGATQLSRALFLSISLACVWIILVFFGFCFCHIFYPQNSLIYLVFDTSNSNRTSKTWCMLKTTISSKQPNHYGHHMQFSCFPTFFSLTFCFYLKCIMFWYKFSKKASRKCQHVEYKDKIAKQKQPTWGRRSQLSGKNRESIAKCPWEEVAIKHLNNSKCFFFYIYILWHNVNQSIVMIRRASVLPLLLQSSRGLGNM